MSKVLPQKERLEDLLDLAKTYRGWSQRELANALDRDPHNLVPGGGIPRLDMVLRLSETLDWPIETLIADLCAQTPESQPAPNETSTWIELDRAAYAAAMEGRIEDLLTLAKRAYAVASTPDQRGYSMIRAAGAWDQLGRYGNAMEAARRGLRGRDLSPVVYSELTAALANAHINLGEIDEGEALAFSLNARLNGDPRFAEVYAGVRSFTHFLMALASRERASSGGDDAARCAQAALDSFQRSREIAASYLAESGSPPHLSLAMASEFGTIEMQVMLGRRDWRDAVESLIEQLTRDSSPGAVPDACLEAIGWACIMGAHMVLRAKAPPEEADRLIAIFTNKAHDLAGRTGNWALRERTWMLEYVIRSDGRIPEPATIVLDAEDLRELTGTMGRFPAFREHGWALLRKSRRTEDEC